MRYDGAPTDMLTRACALWLVALIVAPFSAPFSVCDIATFFDVDHTQSPAAPVTSARSAATIADATTHTLPVVRTKLRVKVMDGAGHSAVRPLASGRAFAARSPGSVPFANSPLVSPLRI